MPISSAIEDVRELFQETRTQQTEEIAKGDEKKKRNKKKMRRIFRRKGDERVKKTEKYRRNPWKRNKFSQILKRWTNDWENYLSIKVLCFTCRLSTLLRTFRAMSSLARTHMPSHKFDFRLWFLWRGSSYVIFGRLGKNRTAENREIGTRGNQRNSMWHEKWVRKYFHSPTELKWSIDFRFPFIHIISKKWCAFRPVKEEMLNISFDDFSSISTHFCYFFEMVRFTQFASMKNSLKNQ